MLVIANTSLECNDSVTVYQIQNNESIIKFLKSWGNFHQTFMLSSNMSVLYVSEKLLRILSIIRSSWCFLDKNFKTVHVKIIFKRILFHN